MYSTSSGSAFRRGSQRGRAGIRIGTAAVALGLLAGACSSTSSSGTGNGGTTPPPNQGAPKDEGAPKAGGTLKVAIPAELDGLSPVSARWSIEGNLVASSIFDPLMTFDENRNLVPKLAQSVTPNADGTEWTITLRPNVTFQDGTPVDGEAVKANVLGRKGQPVTGSALDPVQDVTVTGPLTAVVKMSKPWFGYDYTLAAQGGYLEAPSQINSPDATKKAIGAGPFKQVGVYSPGQTIKVERYDGYWGDKAHLDGINFVPIVDDSARTKALDAGDVDMILTQSPQAIKDYRSTPGITQVEDVAAEEAFAMIGMESPPFNNIHARKALAYATSSQGIVDSIGEGVTSPADGPFIKGDKYFNPDSGYPQYDLAKAREEIEAYKADTGASDLSFKVLTSVGEQTTAVALQGAWAEAGIKAEIDTQEQNTFLVKMFQGQFQVGMFRNFAYVNPDSNYIFWHSSQAKGVGVGSINFGQLKDPNLDKALDAARSNPDAASRAEQYKQLTPTLNATIPYIWLYHNVWALAANDKVGGLGTPQKLGFARQDAKPWWNTIWLKS